VDLELGAVASALLKTPKGAQRPQFDLKYVPLVCVGCIPKSETTTAFPDLPACWSEVLFARELRPVLARALPSGASGVALVVLRASYLALTAPFVSGCACFKAQPAFLFG
jgi:hypothetical protein